MDVLCADFNREFEEVRLRVKGNRVYFWLSLASAVDTPEKQESCRLADVRFERNGHDWQTEVLWQSSVWDEKKHIYRFQNNRLEHWIIVKGKGNISALTYLSGTVGNRERGSVPGFGAVYLACPNFLDKTFVHPSDYAANSVGNVTELWGSALNSGPLMFAFGEFGQEGWISAALHVRPGEYGFQTMAWNKKRPNAMKEQDHILSPQAISLDYPGCVRVDGVWTSPKLVFCAAKNPETCLREYCDDLRRAELVPVSSAQTHAWWREPIFCTWHEQCALAQMAGGGGPDGKDPREDGPLSFQQCTQANISRWLETLETQGIKPGTIIIDAMWQKDLAGNHVDVEKFPDLRGFIEDRHRKGQHVLLWMSAWQTEGLPAEWCVLREGKPVMADPTHPAYRNFVQEMLKRMLGDGPGSYGADGLKIDGTSVMPEGPGLKSLGDLYGFELLRAYFRLVYDSAKTAKHDALISIYGANPYFNDCCDMVRVGDLYTVRGDPLYALSWRAMVFNAALPGKPIDTDGCFWFDIVEGIEEVLERQVATGVPCLYQAENLVQRRAFLPNRIRKFTPQDYGAIRKAWEKYRQRLQPSHSSGQVHGGL